MITNTEQLKEQIGTSVTLRGRVYRIRRMSGFAFLLLQLPKGLVQCTWTPSTQPATEPPAQPSGQLAAKLPAQPATEPPAQPAGQLAADSLPPEQSCVELTGTVAPEPRSHAGFEIHIETLHILSAPEEELPVVVSHKEVAASLDTLLDYRPLTLRNEKERAIFRIQEGICAGAREYLSGQDFTEIHSPKIVSEGAEGGSDVFRLDYFGRQAYLTQSPQFYKQMMAGVYGRVYEIAPVYRAEPHDTSRHLNEYIGIDLEMGYINSFYDICEAEAHLLAHIFSYLGCHLSGELALWGVTLPAFAQKPSNAGHDKALSARQGKALSAGHDKALSAGEDKALSALPCCGGIPCITFAQVKALAANAGVGTDSNDLAPEEERFIGGWIKEQTGSDLVFVTHYPSSKRPFYAMDDPECPEQTLSFDLLLGGLEITTGGQRIHSYTAQLLKMQERGMDPDAFSSYLMIHRYGMPPHGGLGLGLERLTASLLGLANIRRTSLFPRDSSRLAP